MVTEEQRGTIVEALGKMLRAIDASRSGISVDADDHGTDHREDSASQKLDRQLRRWRSDPEGMAVRAGIKEFGKIVAPNVTRDELAAIGADAANQSHNAEWSDAILNHVWDGLVTNDGRVRSA
jgi:hypothetical protein